MGRIVTMSIPDMTVGIVGGGVVGSATARAYAEHVAQVRVWDTDPHRATSDPISVLTSDIIFICLPEDCLDAWAKTVPAECLRNNFVLKSTVPIGTTSRLYNEYGLENIVHSPEFLTSRCAALDAQMPSRNVVGHTEVIPIEENTACHPVRHLYRSRFPGVPLYEMLCEESEALKLISNTFFAVKIAFFNEARSLTEAHKLHWPSILEALLADGRIHPSHTRVPGPDGKFGFGGACLPKDITLFIEEMERLGLAHLVSLAARFRNNEDRTKRGYS